MKRIMHENLNLDSGSPVKIKWCDYDYFKFPLHFHDEYEIVYILKSTGTRFVGNSIQPYSDGDLVLLGSSLPHMYRSDPEYYENCPDLRVHAITIQFSKNFFHYGITHYPELFNIKNLLIKSKQGVCFDKNANHRIRKKITNALIALHAAQQRRFRDRIGVHRGGHPSDQGAFVSETGIYPE